jgi:hypothetical protein
MVAEFWPELKLEAAFPAARREYIQRLDLG